MGSVWVRVYSEPEPAESLETGAAGGYVHGGYLALQSVTVAPAAAAIEY